MNLIDVLTNPEMDRYFHELPRNIQSELLERGSEIHSSNELYETAEQMLQLDNWQADYR